MAYLINKMTVQLNFLSEVIDTIGTGTDGVVLILFSPDSIIECVCIMKVLLREVQLYFRHLSVITYLSKVG